jgi:hypothetical protein
MLVRPLPSPVTPVPYLVLRSLTVRQRMPTRIPLGEQTKLPNSGDGYFAHWEDTSFHIIGSLGTPGRRYENISRTLFTFTLLS